MKKLKAALLGAGNRGQVIAIIRSTVRKNLKS